MLRSALASLTLLSIAAFPSLGAAQADASAKSTTVVLVESSQPSPAGRGEALSREGHSRAFDLLPVFDHAELAAVYSTNDAPTFETGRLVAEHLGVSRIPYDYDATQPERVARALLSGIRNANAGKTVLVVLPRDVLVPFVEAATQRGEQPVLDPRTLLVLTLDGEAPSMLRTTF